MLLFLNKSGLNDVRARVVKDEIEEKVFRTRFEESQAIEKEDRESETDRRKGEHWKRLKGLYDALDEVQKPLSLDQYFHKDLKEEEVQQRVTSQVVSRFAYYQHKFLSHEPREKNSAVSSSASRRDGRTLHKSFWDLVPGLTRLFMRKPKEDEESVLGASSGASSAASSGASSEASSYAHPAEHPEQDRETKFDSPRKQILVVPQLWLFTIDSKSGLHFHSSVTALKVEQKTSVR